MDETLLSQACMGVRCTGLSRWAGFGGLHVVLIPFENVTEEAAGDGFFKYRSVHVPVRICRPLRIATYVTVHVLSAGAFWAALAAARGYLVTQ